MTNIHQELEEGVKVLDIIDRRRLESGDHAIGSAIERAIIDRCLAQLEDESKVVAISKPATLAKQPGRQPRKKPGSRSKRQ